MIFIKIAIAGTGYVGIVTGVCLASIGHQVTCVDVEQSRIDILKMGKSPIYEPGLEDLMQKHFENLKFTIDYKAAYKDAEVIFIGVGTPEKKDGSANLGYVFEAAKQIASAVKKNCVIVVKSTVPIGTNDKIEAIIKANLSYDVTIQVASNPEFLSQGTAVKDTLQGARIVLGVESKKAEEVLKRVYDGFGQPYVVTNRRSAEMIKYASNDFLALKISYINEIANLCEVIGADIEDVALGMGLDSRIGSKFLRAGIGYGGSCFPKDTKALHWLANYYDYELKTVKAAIEVNENQKIRLIKKARKYYESLTGLTVAVLGLAFKPETDDLREAPSLNNVLYFLEDGAKVKAWDPVAIQNFKQHYSDDIIYCKSIEDTIRDADICFIFTEWDEVKNFDCSKYSELMKKPIVLDGRNCYALDSLEGIKMVYESVGRAAVSNMKIDD